MNTLSFSIPWPPSVNHCYKPRRGGGQYMTREAEEFKAEAKRCAKNGWPPTWAPPFIKRGKSPTLLVVELNYFSPDWRGDVDNTLKLTLDAIAAGIEYNDRYFLPRAMGRVVDKVNPRIEVRVYCEEAFGG